MGKKEWPLTIEKVDEIVEHLLNDGSRDGLILANDLNMAMGRSARRLAESLEPLTCQPPFHLPGCEHYGPPTPPLRPLQEEQ